jgi:Pyridoxal-phosphate dependent enzyme
MTPWYEPRTWFTIASLATGVMCTFAIVAQHRRKPSAPASEGPRNDDDESRKRWSDTPCDGDDANLSAYEALVGRTPTVKLQRLSFLLQRNIYVKMESMNPGGTGKDRAALGMIRAAQARGELPPPLPPSSVDNASRSSDGNVAGSVSESEPLKQQTPQTNTPTPSSTAEHDSLIRQAMMRSRTGGLVVEGTSGSYVPPFGLKLVELSPVSFSVLIRPTH